MAKVFECERDRAPHPGKDDDELVANGKRHLPQTHRDLVLKLSREWVLANPKES
jgi:hypothetical protein